jgi:hypothetical protein
VADAQLLGGAQLDDPGAHRIGQCLQQLIGWG